MRINERLQAAAQAIDELFPDQAGARERYEQLMTALQTSEKTPSSPAINADSPSTAGPQPAPERTADSRQAQELSDRERRVIEVIRDSVQRRGYPPSLREIGQAVGLSSTSSVAHHLITLERKGFLRRDTRRPRSYELPGSTHVFEGQFHRDVEASRALAMTEMEGGGVASDQGPAVQALPGEEALKEQVRAVWIQVEKLRRDSDEQRHWFHRKPLTNAELAHHIGKSGRTVGRWLRDKTFMPPRKEFLAIVELLGGDPEEFDLFWCEGYEAYEALKGLPEETATGPARPREAPGLVSAAEG